MLSTTTVLILFCVGISARPSPNTRSGEMSSSSNDHCQESLSNSSTCSFHDTCIEAIYQCGPTGVALGYAKPRCESLSALQLSDSGCQECIRTQAILDWALLSERCFQSKLLCLARNQTSEPFPDPPDCLHFEQNALEALQTCYLENDTICQLMESESLDVLESDLKVVMDAILVNSYYEGAVIMHMRNLVTKCSFAQSTSLANKIAPETERMFLCVSLTSRLGLIEEGLTEALAERLNQSSTDFTIVSFDPKLDVSCQIKSDPAWYVSSADYFVVHWTLAEGADKSALSQCQYAGSHCIVDGDKTLIYFEYTSLTTSTCGNGRREAKESCDAFVYTGMDGYGCNEHCQAVVDYECTTGQLKQSLCKKTLCGDGLRTSDEECDVGHESSAGCNLESCTIQNGYQCDTPYNATSQCTEVLTTSQIIPTSTKFYSTGPSTLLSLSQGSSSVVQSPELEPTKSSLELEPTKSSLELEPTKSTDHGVQSPPPSLQVIVGVGSIVLAVFAACSTLVTCVFCRRLKKLPRSAEPRHESFGLELSRDDENEDAGAELRQLTDSTIDKVAPTSDSAAKRGNLGRSTSDEVDQKKDSTPKRARPTCSTVDKEVRKTDLALHF